MISLIVERKYKIFLKLVSIDKGFEILSFIPYDDDRLTQTSKVRYDKSRVCDR